MKFGFSKWPNLIKCDIFLIFGTYLLPLKIRFFAHVSKWWSMSIVQESNGGGGRLQQKYAATLAVGEGKSTEVGFYETISIPVQNSTERPWKRVRFNRLPSFGQPEELSFVPPCLVLTKGPGISFFIICDFLFDIQNNEWLVLYFITLLILVICGSTLECSRLEVKFLHFYESIAKNDL